MHAGQAGDHVAQPLPVLVHPHGARQVHCAVVPRWHHAAVFGLRRVPGRADVGLGARTDQQHWAAGGDGLPLRVGTRHVGKDDAPVPHDRQQGSDGNPIGIDRDELGRSRGGDEAPNLVVVGDSVEGRGVHLVSKGSMKWR